MIHILYIYLIIGAFIGGINYGIFCGGWGGAALALYCFVAWPVHVAWCLLTDWRRR